MDQTVEGREITVSPRQQLFAEIIKLRDENDNASALQEEPEHPIKTGDLKKTTQSRNSNATLGSTRERRFQLTKVAIEYLERFSHVKVRRSFPFTSIESVEQDDQNKCIFKLVFSSTVMILEAPSPEEADDWTKKIREVWTQWHAGGATPTDSILHSSNEGGYPEEHAKEALATRGASPIADGGSDAEKKTSTLPTGTSNTKQNKHLWRRGLIKRRVQQHPPHLERLLSNRDTNEQVCHKLHEEYAMIKYPHKKWFLPNEKLLHIDRDNLHIMWRRSGISAFHMSNTLPLYQVWEIREGQRTKWFHHFPYEEVDGQSFSLIYEEERYGGKYIALSSLDLICDHPAHYGEWINGIFSWLKRLWTTKYRDHELPEKAIVSLQLAIHPSCDVRLAKQYAMIAHQHQLNSTTNYGRALLWDGFTLLFNLMCEVGRLFQLFKFYAKTFPTLGLTKEEFGDFLIEQCLWRRGDCPRNILLKLMDHHDYHHKSFKKYAARNKPLEFSIAMTKPLLSYAGFLSFLRSSDNALSEKEEQSQDMDQPLSHYFVNSSHNTYLEEDQIKGPSSCEAYVRALLQGCRCIEIDCWDGALRVGGESVVIYHGYTFTTKLEFSAVITTIRDYAFYTSLYPVIISIENHCSPSNQTYMAKHFLEIMGDVLCKENLVEKEGRERLPSPTELQGKIILKGTFKKEVRAAMSSVPSESSITTAVLQKTKSTILSEEQLNIASNENQDMVSVYGLNAPKMVEQDDQETAFVEDTAKDLENLIVYCRSISIKPWSWAKQEATAVSEMFSFGEPSAIKLCKNSYQDMLLCTEKQLVRTYPKGTRFDSSNYDPTLMWACGIQMVALNFQTPDVWMHLNQGFFRQNGGCGYVLKPEIMRKRPNQHQSQREYSPFMTEPHPDIPTVDLEIELISGQQLCPYKKKCVFLTVDIKTYGIPADIHSMPQASNDSAFWPQWDRGSCVYAKRKILMPDLCLVYFRVEVQYKIGNPQVFGQNCIPLLNLKPGVKFVPLRTSGGEVIQGSGLFVNITKQTDNTTTVRNSQAPRLVHQTGFDESSI